jgi:RHS repeat-associated protein
MKRVATKEHNVLSVERWTLSVERFPGLTMTVYPAGAGATNRYDALTDEAGSVCALAHTGFIGAIAEQYRYDAWGRTTFMDSGFAGRPRSLYGLRFLFQGGEFSEATGLVRFGARWYSPDLGRWLSPDPIGLEGGLNLYEFCANNPVNFTDTSGLWSVGVTVYNGSDPLGPHFAQGARWMSYFNYDMGNDQSLRGAIDYLRRIKKLGFTISRFSIVDHGLMSSRTGEILGQRYNDVALRFLPGYSEDMCELGCLLDEHAVIHLMGCRVGGNAQIVQDYANASGRRVTASTTDVHFDAISNVIIWHRSMGTVITRSPE